MEDNEADSELWGEKTPDFDEIVDGADHEEKTPPLDSAGLQSDFLSTSSHDWGTMSSFPGDKTDASVFVTPEIDLDRADDAAPEDPILSGLSTFRGYEGDQVPLAQDDAALIREGDGDGEGEDELLPFLPEECEGDATYRCEMAALERNGAAAAVEAPADTDKTVPYLSLMYPNQDDPKFNLKIAAKAEFAENKYNGDIPQDIEAYANHLASASYELQPHQQFVINYASPDTPYTSILLYHGLGTGKTCSAIGIAETSREEMKRGRAPRQRILVVADEIILSQFRRELFDPKRLVFEHGKWILRQCVGGSILGDVLDRHAGFNAMRVTATATEQDRVRARLSAAMERMVEQYYEFVTYEAMSDKIVAAIGRDEYRGYETKLTAQMRERVQAVFGGRRIIVDEIHKLRKAATPAATTTTPAAKTGNLSTALDLLVRLADGMRFVFLSATPMFNTHAEIIWILNLMNANDRRPLLRVKDVFDKLGHFVEPGGEEALAKHARGYISFVRGDNPFTFPYRVYPRQFLATGAVDADDGGDGPTTVTDTSLYPAETINGQKLEERKRPPPILNLFLSRMNTTCFHLAPAEPRHRLSQFGILQSDTSSTASSPSSSSSPPPPSSAPLAPPASSDSLSSDDSTPPPPPPSSPPLSLPSATAACGRCQFCVYRQLYLDAAEKSPAFATKYTFGYNELLLMNQSLVMSYPLPGPANEAVRESSSQSATEVFGEEEDDADKDEKEEAPPEDAGGTEFPAKERENNTLLPNDPAEEDPAAVDETIDPTHLALQSKRNSSSSTVAAATTAAATTAATAATTAPTNSPMAASAYLRDIDPTDLVGTGGLARFMQFETDPARIRRHGFQFRYRDPDPNNRLFSRERIGTHSAKIAQVLNYIHDPVSQFTSEGVILIYSNFVSGGLIPMALALEEMGMERYRGTGKAKNLFADPPPDSHHEGASPRPAYIAITGNTAFSPDNRAEIEAATSDANLRGGLVRVILLSRKGAEGIDFKFIRQTHILDPWYNINLLEQILGRAIRSFAFRASDGTMLPFVDRNTMIFLHALVFPVLRWRETTDLFMYRLAEMKAYQMGKVSRLLKETAVDCLIHHSQFNFTQDKFDDLKQQNKIRSVSQRLSDGHVIADFPVGDAPFSAMCDYQESCEVSCRPSASRKIKTNLATYTESHALAKYEAIAQRVRAVFREKYFALLSNLVAAILENDGGAKRKWTKLEIMSVLTAMLEDPNEILRDKFGRPGRLVNVGNYYLFQPLGLANPQASVGERSRPPESAPTSVEVSAAATTAQNRGDMLRRRTEAMFRHDASIADDDGDAEEEEKQNDGFGEENRDEGREEQKIDKDLALAPPPPQAQQRATSAAPSSDFAKRWVAGMAQYLLLLEHMVREPRPRHHPVKAKLETVFRAHQNTLFSALRPDTLLGAVADSDVHTWFTHGVIATELIRADLAHFASQYTDQNDVFAVHDLIALLVDQPLRGGAHTDSPASSVRDSVASDLVAPDSLALSSNQSEDPFHGMDFGDDFFDDPFDPRVPDDDDVLRVDAPPLPPGPPTDGHRRDALAAVQCGMLYRFVDTIHRAHKIDLVRFVLSQRQQIRRAGHARAKYIPFVVRALHQYFSRQMIRLPGAADPSSSCIAFYEPVDKKEFRRFVYVWNEATGDLDERPGIDAAAVDAAMRIPVGECGDYLGFMGTKKYGDDKNENVAFKIVTLEHVRKDARKGVGILCKNMVKSDILAKIEEVARGKLSLDQTRVLFAQQCEKPALACYLELLLRILQRIHEVHPAMIGQRWACSPEQGIAFGIVTKASLAKTRKRAERKVDLLDPRHKTRKNKKPIRPVGAPVQPVHQPFVPRALTGDRQQIDLQEGTHPVSTGRQVHDAFDDIGFSPLSNDNSLDVSFP